MEKTDGRCFMCRKEGTVFNLKDFGTMVCSDCLPEFVKRRVLTTLRSFHMISPGDIIAVGVSGGKDSATLLNALNAISKRLDVSIRPFHLNLGFGEFSEIVENAAKKAAELSGLELQVFYLSDFEVRVERIGSFPPCAVCGALKRTIFNRIARELKANVLATAHTFDDIFLFALKNLVSGKDNIPPAVSKPISELLPRKIKPLYRIPEYLTEEYCRILDIPYVKGECPVSDGRGHALKKVLAEIDGVSPSFRKQILQALKRIYKKAGKPVKEPVYICEICGEPSTQKICPLCRVRDYQLRAGKKC